MTARTWAMAFFVVITVLYVAGLALTLTAGQPLSLNEALYPVLYTFAVVGFLIARNRPGNAIAWICLAIGFVWGLEASLTGIAAYGLAHPGTVPSPDALAAIAVFLWFPGIFVIPFLFMFFPDGRLPSPRWQWLPWSAGAVIVGGYPLILLTWIETYSYGRDNLRFDNPLVRLPQSWELVPVMLAFATAAASIVALVVRYRRSREIERQQLKWLATAGSSYLLLAILLFGWVVDLLGDLGESAGLIGFGFSVVIPISIGIAVLRYRLYEIDRLISRTVTYALVVGLLAAVAASIAIVLPRVMGVPDENPVLVAGATLAAAALFNPLRRRIQDMVDRRFNRSRYDAQQEVERFSERLRAELEIEDLSNEVLGVVSKTVQPTSAVIWVREEP